MKTKNYTVIKRLVLPFLLLNFIFMILSCKNESREQLERNRQIYPDTISDREVEVKAYTGNISSINTTANKEAGVTGNIAIRIEGDLVRFTVTAENLAPDMMHRQFLLTAGQEGNLNCPGQNADANKDGIIDIKEFTQASTGVNVIPLHMGPSTLETNVDTYPKTNINGEMYFSRTTNLDSLRTSVNSDYGIDDIDWSQMIYVVQGIPGDVTLQQTVQSDQDISAQQTVPVGCARLEETRVKS